MEKLDIIRPECPHCKTKCRGRKSWRKWETGTCPNCGQDMNILVIDLFGVIHYIKSRASFIHEKAYAKSTGR